ncbi:MAG: hypothetical protein ABL891_05335 [Burkholderiales bacterium]
MSRAKSLAKPLIVFVIVALAAIGMVKFTLDRSLAAEQQFSAQQAQLRDAQARVQKSGTEKELIIRYLPGYRQLAATGFVGDEQRINWLDALRVVNQKGELFGIDYDVSPRRPYPLAATLSPGQMSVMQSMMKLRFQLLHEGDLQRFFELLSNQNAGLFMVDQCTLKRSASAPSIRFQPHLAAECQLSWITAQPAEQPGAKP